MATTKEEETVQKFLDFYIDLVEKNSSTVKFYLADNVVLDWFGKTIRDSKKVSFFISDQVSKVTHHVTNSFPSENVAFKDSHKVQPKTKENFVLIPPNEEACTPPKRSQPSTSTIEIAQEVILSPPKKMKYNEDDEEHEILETEAEVGQMKYLTAEGSVEFHKPSIKKLQAETRWKRPMKLHLGYTFTSIQDCTIYLIIYEGNLKCRRNLYKEFCDSTKNS